IQQMPVELLRNIFTLACTDGGFTGCSLSLVCKHFREVARPCRFFSVKLNIVTNLLRPEIFVRSFQAEISREVGSERPRIRHLHIES
ncbi:uncharacterized protein BXZ73DRAFT_3553, partial [Epithele typhae]|uniref:uncharacterized protein n=1 Tax=Epithele typhae TaxID=378194 RepID=UPI0020080A94